MTDVAAAINSLIGPLTLIADDDALTGVYFDGHRYPPAQAAVENLIQAQTHPVLAQAAGELTEYLTGERTSFSVSIRTAGGPLQERVWARLQQISRGQTVTYGAIAAELGDPALAQAVGQAVGHNPLSIVIPCHRVLGADGRLTGFAGGLARKQFLLDLEGAGQATLF